MTVRVLTSLLLVAAMLGGALWLIGFGDDEPGPGAVAVPAAMDAPASPAAHSIAPLAAASDALVEPARVGVLADAVAPASIDGLDVPPPELLTETIRGVARSEKGDLLPGVKVVLSAGLGGGPNFAVPFEDYTAEDLTDARGAFAFKVPPVGVFTLAAEKEGFAKRTIAPLMPQDDVNLVLAQGERLNGVLVDDETELPVQGGTVRIERAGAWITVTSGDDGRFVAADLEAGAARVEVYARGYDVHEESGVVVGGEARASVTFRLARAPALAGTVIDGATGSPIAGAVVEIGAEERFGSPWSGRSGGFGAFGGRRGGGDDEEGEDEPPLLHQAAVTDARGAFRFDAVSRDEMELTVRKEGYATERDGVRDPGAGGERSIEIALVAESRVGGRVVGPDGSGVPRATVVLDGVRDADEVEVEADDEGYFTLQGVPPNDRFRLVASALRDGLAPALVEDLEVEQGKSLGDLVIALQKGAVLEGRVVDALGQPAPFARVTFEEIPWSAWRAIDSQPVRFADQEGKFRVADLPPVAARMTAWRDGARSEPLEIALAAGAVHQVELVLEEGILLEGLVLDAGGMPVDDVSVAAFASDGNVSFGTRIAIDDRGRFRRPEGAGGGPDRGGPGGSGGSDGGDGPRRFFERAMRDMNRGGLSERVMAAATGSGGRGLTSFRAIARTGADGRFVLKGLEEDETLTVSFRHPDYARRMEFDVRVPREALRVELAPLLSLAGRVVDDRTRAPIQRFSASAQPVRQPQTEVTLADMMNGQFGRSGWFRSEAGTFVLEGLQPGEYDVTIRAEGFKEMEPRRIVAATGASVETLFTLVPAAEVTGRVTARDGSAVERLSVYLQPVEASGGFADDLTPRKGNVTTRRTGRDGSYRFTDVEPGAYALGVGNRNDPIAGPVLVNVTDGAQIEHAFTLGDLGELVVEVSGSSGFALERAVVTLRNDAIQYRDANRTDGFGRTRFTNLVPGTYDLQVAHDGYVTAAEQVRIREGDDATQKLTLSRQ